MIIHGIQYKMLGIMGDRIYLQRMTPKAIRDWDDSMEDKIGRKIRFNSYMGYYIDIDSTTRISLIQLFAEWGIYQGVQMFSKGQVND